MNQLFNTVNYFEFQAFEALHNRETSRRLQAQTGITPFSYSYFFLLLLTFPIVPGNKKAAEAFLRAAAF